MTREITNEVIILCEGAADQSFIKKLIALPGGFPPIDFLPPEIYYGRDRFDQMLSALKGTGVSFSRIKGVLIIADSHDEPASTFGNIQEQIRNVPDYPVPDNLLTPAPPTPGHPSLAVMLLPDEETPGALESLFARELEARNPWVTGCVDKFLRCRRMDAYRWPPEKHAKARYHSLVAALHRADPSRSASAAFTSSPPVMAIGTETFDSVERCIKDFCRVVGVE
jgi:hypothetical protein